MELVEQFVVFPGYAFATAGDLSCMDWCQSCTVFPLKASQEAWFHISRSLSWREKPTAVMEKNSYGAVVETQASGGTAYERRQWMPMKKEVGKCSWIWRVYIQSICIRSCIRRCDVDTPETLWCLYHDWWSAVFLPCLPFFICGLTKKQDMFGGLYVWILGYARGWNFLAGSTLHFVCAVFNMYMFHGVSVGQTLTLVTAWKKDRWYSSGFDYPVKTAGYRRLPSGECSICRVKLYQLVVTLSLSY